MNRRLALLVGHAFFVFLLYASSTTACSSGSDPAEEGLAGDAGADTFVDERLFLGDTRQRETPSCLKCSADMHAILDCEGNVFQPCDGDQACYGNKCVPACDAAETSKSSIGCDYYTINPDGYDANDGSCFAVYIVNTWGVPVVINMEYGGQTFAGRDFAYIPSGNGLSMEYEGLPEGKLPSGQVAVLFLASTPDAMLQCPKGLATALTTDPALHGTGYGKAFHIMTSLPVVAYDIYPYGGGDSAITSATLLLPTSAWDTNYIAVDAWPGDAYPPWTAIVGKEDGTTVTLSPTAAIVGGNGVPASAKGALQTYTLNRGQVLQLEQMDELTGTPIETTKPVGVWGGNVCMFVFDGPCDSAHQEIPPVRSLGSEYVAVRHRNRFVGVDESPPWRMVGAVDGTLLTYVPAKPAGAPDSLQSGDLVEFRASEPFVVKSQDKDHPFYVGAYMTGCDEYSTDVNDCRGDPEWVNVVPPKQFLGSYTFFTDPTYPETDLVVIRAKSGSSFEPVNLDCAGDLGDWHDLGDYQWTRVDLVTGNFEPIGGCDNGKHVMKSNGPFGVTVWGWGSGATKGEFMDPSVKGFYTQTVSYAYPAGASVEPLSSVVVRPKPN